MCDSLKKVKWKIIWVTGKNKYGVTRIKKRILTNTSTVFV